MTYETVILTTEGNVGILTFNRPKAMNALNTQIFMDISAAFDEIEADSNIRCVVMKGEGRAFCAGGDIPEMKTLATAEQVFEFYDIAGNTIKKMINCSKPVIAAAHGPIAGAGTSMLLSADIALVSENAKFIVAFGQVGLIPDSAAHYLLPRAVGLNMAKELMMTQRAVDAKEMKELRIANHVYPDDQLMAEAMKLAEKIAKGPSNCYASSKMLMNKSFESTLEESLEEETKLQAEARLHENAEEGLTAFLEKRKANFK